MEMQRGITEHEERTLSYLNNIEIIDAESAEYPQRTKNATKKRFRKHMKVHRRMLLAVATLTCASTIQTVDGFAGFQGAFPQHQHHLNQNHVQSFADERYNPHSQARACTALMYAPSNHPTTKTAPMVAQAFYSSYTTNRNPAKPRNQQIYGGALSNSVLSSSDTLPAFPTAHGLLSPETVMRMEVMTSSATRDEAVDYFLRTYRKDGPMACLPMLSDPKILPRLTEAMRDIML
mmetsp:Transcript_12058/g.14012  ORF Transcript_12058/g.14012 Transcript_12058/m.14012 type:complete len:234 (-) Transcript_12058:385-1086(-)